MGAREAADLRGAGTGLAESAAEHPPLLLSVDFEDWHQLARRRLGVSSWEEPGPALARQTDALLALLDELGAAATFFVLGMSARAHPTLVQRIRAQGHEIACHGDRHVPVHSQSPRDFAADLAQARRTIEDLAGVRPVGYRAPAFSITRDSDWAFDVLVEEGFVYDSSRHDSPRIRRRIPRGHQGPHPMCLSGGTLWEFPVAVWQLRGHPVPVGGASYWAVLPAPVILHGLSRAEAGAGLYLHPQELDPQRLDVQLPTGAGGRQRALGHIRAAQRNLARWRAADILRSIAGRHRLISYGEAYASLAHRTAAGP